jgi:hypothetical protein
VISGYFGAFTYTANGVRTSSYNFIDLDRVTIHPNNQTFVAITGTNKFIVADWFGNYINIPTTTGTYDCDYSDDGKYLAVGGLSFTHIYNATDNTFLTSVPAQSIGGVYGTRLTSNSRYLLAATAGSGQVYLYYRSDYYYINCT